ncbi:BQ2448_2347 [Microbotryum intermedium]|uniref:BQ2448_2340 protein n=1 Tax=Microbotryum intermedium TaxID=269621 RepID=A0A238F5X6_9BASI|nr:BQ2448_2340 [Microbotryum intermedium]SCV69327.1 BQ2448_2347 [Microbotryum intermedium]
MQNQVPTVFTCTHFVRILLELANSCRAAGPTYTKVAPLGKDLEIILGGNFIYRHKMELGLCENESTLSSPGQPRPARTPARVSPTDQDLGARHLPSAPATLPMPASGLNPDLFPQPHLTCKAVPAQAVDLLALLSQPRAPVPVAVIAPVVDNDEQLRLAALDHRLRKEFADLFPEDIPPVHSYQSPVQHRIELDSPSTIVNLRGYPLPKKYRESWYLLLQEHFASGRLRPSRLSYSSPLFIIPKKGSDMDAIRNSAVSKRRCQVEKDWEHS